MRLKDTGRQRNWPIAVTIRVHELAKELGVTSKEILIACSNHGEFVKSSSSTLEGPLTRRLREYLCGRRVPSTQGSA
ncbi:MAG: translation initiation factor IF-2 N-terminal domain-containing protein [Mycobacterium sp.]|nr:translation initiation factor IF-2 N-terminal domain-containing protein [Mycobacterium sp.]